MPEPRHDWMTVEPTFIKMGNEDLINLNNVQHIRLLREKDGSGSITVFLQNEKALTFEIDDCDSFERLLADLIPFRQNLKR